jgi:HlyD family secretion protein
MKKKIWIAAGVVVVLLIVVVASVKKSHGQKGIPVTLANIKSGAIVGKVKGPGPINPESIVDISARLPGVITHLAVHEGDVVTKGQLLLALDPTKFGAWTDQAKAAVESRKSQVELSRAEDEKAQADLKRSEDLHARGLLSEQELDLARTTSKVAGARLHAVEKDYDQAVANLNAAQDDLDKCRYTSPMDGIVSSLNIKEGEMAVTGTMNNPGTVLLSIADLSRMEVQSEVDETDVVDVKVGQKARIKVDAIPDTSFAGVVKEIANTAITRNRGTQEEVTNFTVKVLITDQVAQLRPGMSATVEIETASRDNALRVPIQAIVSRNPEKEKRELERSKKGRTGKGEAAVAAETGDAKAGADDEEDDKDKRVDGVYAFRDGRAVFVPVEKGISDTRYIEAKTGVATGDRVVTGPYQTLRTLKAGTRVREKPAEALEKQGKEKN